MRKGERSSKDGEEMRPAMIAVGGRGWASLVEEKIEVGSSELASDLY